MRWKILAIPVAGILFCIIVIAALMPSEQSSSCVSENVGEVKNLTVKGKAIEKEQQENSAAIVGVAKKKSLPKKAAVIAIATAIQESTLYNLNYGYPGSTSLGLFQQIAAWGPVADRTNPVKSAGMFYFGGQAGQRGLTDIPDYVNMPVTVAAQAVQGSAYPDAYAPWETEAITIVGALWGDGSSNNGENCDTVDPLELAVRAALKMIGDSYQWPSSDDVQYDGAGFVEEAFEAADVNLPGTIEDLAAYEGSEDGSVTATFIPASDFKSGAESLKRGDILLTSEDGGNRREDAERAGIYVGSALDTVRVATYNVLGSSHTPRTGPDSGPVRIEKAHKLITSNNFTVVGLQELQPNQREKLMKLLGSDWGIYPQKPTYGNSPIVSAVNSIIWDKTQVELMEGRDLDMPRYFGGARMQIPLVKLRQIVSDEQFYVANTHDPAHPENADLRLESAKQHAADSERLVAEGYPVFFVGDFNSSFRVKSKGNTTYGGRRENLTWCVMTKSGTMVNGYDASRKPPRLGYCPSRTSQERSGGPDHVYVSRDVSVSKFEVISGRSKTGSDHDVVYVETRGLEAPSGGKKDKGGDKFVGPDPDTGVISLMSVPKRQMVGVLRLKIEPRTVDVGGIDGELVLPIVKGQYLLTARYGETGPNWATYHTGLDFAAPSGIQVYAVAGGEIVSTEYHSAYGNRLIIRTSDGWEFWYCHLSKYDLTSGSVEAGTSIGKVGATGNVTGSHLHLEVRNPDGADVNPFEFLQSHGLNP